MREKGRVDVRSAGREPDSSVRVRPLGLDERTLAIARSVAPEMERLLAAYDARVQSCDHLAFDDLTGAITYKDGDRILFRGVVEELARLDTNDVLTFVWRDQPNAPPPTPRVDAARSMLKGLGVAALRHG